jgi:predicted GNAT family acetyltransferase
MTGTTTEPTSGAAVEVRDVRPGRRFVLVVDGALAGTAEYRLDGDDVAILHTELDPAFEGRGLGSTFVREMLRQVADRGGTVLPYCPFVRGYLQRHRDFVHLVPAARRAEFDLDQPAQG